MKVWCSLLYITLLVRNLYGDVYYDPYMSDARSKVLGPWKGYPLATFCQNFKNFKERVFELTTSFWLYHFSRLLEKNFEIFFYLGLHNGHGCFWPNFHIHNLFRFVSAAVRTQKTKIFPFSKNMQIWDTLKGFGWPRMMETQYSRVLGPQKNFHHFWEHWPAHFFTTWWIRSSVSFPWVFR